MYTNWHAVRSGGALCALVIRFAVRAFRICKHVALDVGSTCNFAFMFSLIELNGLFLEGGIHNFIILNILQFGISGYRWQVQPIQQLLILGIYFLGAFTWSVMERNYWFFMLVNRRLDDD